MIILGITGPTGAGKSTVSKIFKKYGVEIIDTDILARKIVEPKKPALKELAEAFGKNILNDDGTLKRSELARLAFSDPARLKILNSITHRYIKEEIKTYESMGCGEYQDIRICKTVPNSKGFVYPLLQGWVTSNYTSNRDPVYSNGQLVSSGAHYGIDLGGMKEGTPVYAAAPGMVTRLVIKSSCGGNQVFVEHRVNNQIYTTVYMHLLSISVSKGDIVGPTTEIGKVGGDSTSATTRTGKKNGGYDWCTNGTHLHFGVSNGSYSTGTYGFNANSFNPTKILDFSKGYFSR